MKTNSNILIIANKKIFPTLDGGAMAMKKMSELLLAQNYKVDIVCISKQNKPSKANNPIIKKIDSNFIRCTGFNILFIRNIFFIE